MVSKIKQLVCLKTPIFMFVFAAGVLNGCSNNHNQISNHRLVLTIASDTPGCPIIDFVYTDKIGTGFCIEADNLASSGVQIAGVCTLTGQDLTNPFSIISTYPIYMDCTSGSLSSNDLVGQPLYALGGSIFDQTINVGDEISYTIACYVYGEKRVQQTYKYTATVASTDC